jgi:hypothetical protein
MRPLPILLFLCLLPAAYAAPPETVSFKTLWGVYNPSYTDNFYSVDPSQIDIAVNTYGYCCKKKVAMVDAQSMSNAFVTDNTLAFWRTFKGVPAIDHFYTTDLNERGLVEHYYGYTVEGVEGFLHQTQTPSTVFLYRLSRFWSDTQAVEHWYGTDSNERYNRIATGYFDEGAAGFVWPIPPVNQPLPGHYPTVVIYKDSGYQDLYAKGPAVVEPGGGPADQVCGGTVDIYRDNVFVQQVAFTLRRNRYDFSNFECYAPISSIAFGTHTYRAEFSGYAFRVSPNTGSPYISYHVPYTFEGDFAM